MGLAHMRRGEKLSIINCPALKSPQNLLFTIGFSLGYTLEVKSVNSSVSHYPSYSPSQCKCTPLYIYHQGKKNCQESITTLHLMSIISHLKYLPILISNHHKHNRFMFKSIYSSYQNSKDSEGLIKNCSMLTCSENNESASGLQSPSYAHMHCYFDRGM